MNCKKSLFMACWAAMAATAQAQITIDIDAQQRGPKVSPMLYGIFYEDINHAADGGIYAELIRNRSFEDGPRFGAPADMQGWATVAAEPSVLAARLIQDSKKTPLLNSAQHHALQLDVKASPAAPVSLINEGMEENTLQQPTTIHPVEQQLSTADDHVMLTVPPYSLNIVTIKTS